MNTTHPVVERYLAELARGLGSIPADDRRDIVREIDEHIADATTSGRPLDEVLEALGPVSALARAYTVETLLNPASQERGVDRWLRIIGFLAIASLPSFIVIVVLGALGTGLLFGGAAAFVAGLVTHLGADGLVDGSPTLAIAAGLPLMVVGVGCFGALVYYVRFLIRLARTALPHGRATGVSI